MHPTPLLRGEGAAVAAVAIAALYVEGAPLWLVVVLALAPDLGMVGYLRTPRVGAWTYNSLHWYPLPLALGAGGVVWSVEFAVWSALVWIAHIGVDRAVGYGLKHEDGFASTHLSRGSTPDREPDPEGASH